MGRKYAQNGFFLFIVPLVILVACGNSEPKITQAEVETIVQQHLAINHNKDENKIKITSVTNDRGEYSVVRGMDENCEFGIIQVDDQNGEIIKSVETNCQDNEIFQKILFY